MFIPKCFMRLIWAYFFRLRLSSALFFFTNQTKRIRYYLFMFHGWLSTDKIESRDEQGKTGESIVTHTNFCAPSNKFPLHLWIILLSLSPAIHLPYNTQSAFSKSWDAENTSTRTIKQITAYSNFFCLPRKFELFILFWIVRGFSFIFCISNYNCVVLPETTENVSQV